MLCYTQIVKVQNYCAVFTNSLKHYIYTIVTVKAEMLISPEKIAMRATYSIKYKNWYSISQTSNKITVINYLTNYGNAHERALHVSLPLTNAQ